MSRYRPKAVKNPDVVKNPCGVLVYEPLKAVTNICPRCGSSSYMELRHISKDEGRKVCRKCRHDEHMLTDEEWLVTYGSLGGNND